MRFLEWLRQPIREFPGLVMLAGAFVGTLIPWPFL